MDWDCWPVDDEMEDFGIDILQESPAALQLGYDMDQCIGSDHIPSLSSTVSISTSPGDNKVPVIATVLEEEVPTSSASWSGTLMSLLNTPLRFRLRLP
jgi:hypothetical protein